MDKVIMVGVYGLLAGVFWAESLFIGLYNTHNLPWGLLSLGMIGGVLSFALMIRRAHDLVTERDGLKRTIAEREREYAVVVARFLAHVDQTDVALQRFNVDGGAPENTCSKVQSATQRARIEGLWTWIHRWTSSRAEARNMHHKPPTHSHLVWLMGDWQTAPFAPLDYALREQVKAATGVYEDEPITMA